MLLVAASYVVINLATDLFYAWWIRGCAMSTDAAAAAATARRRPAEAPARAAAGALIVAAVALVAVLAPALPLRRPQPDAAEPAAGSAAQPEHPSARTTSAAIC